MSILNRWRLATGLILGLAPGLPAMAQGLPEALPMPASPSAELPPPVAIPSPTVIHVPPAGPGPSWQPGAIDPVATARHRPKFVVLKSRSWHWRRFQGKALGYPEEFQPRPLGAALYDHGRTMVANGAAAKLVLFQFDFEEGTSRLNSRGQDQLARLAAQLAASPYPLIIERTPDRPALAESRRFAVLAALCAGPFPVTSNRVLVGAPIPTGLSGIDAQIIGANALERTKDYGPPIPISNNGVNSPSGVTSK
ncbi:MAG: hypothetical protein JWN86_1576 [Planctomycetota bacterium]|nr:hypothetical protein [Planctomycetota bacterium]